MFRQVCNLIPGHLIPALAREHRIDCRKFSATSHVYYCPSSNVTNGRGQWCLRVGGARLDRAVSAAFLEVVAPAGMQAALQAEEMIEAEHDSALAQWRLQVEQARYQTERAERRYRSVEPENRLVARTLEAEWEKRLDELTAAEGELTRREHQRPQRLTDEQRESIHRLGTDLNRAWEAPTTTDRDRKELLRALLEEVNVAVNRAEAHAQPAGPKNRIRPWLHGQSCQQPPASLEDPALSAAPKSSRGRTPHRRKHG